MENRLIFWYNKEIMPIEAVKIPQNVYIEDRIIGPITLKQLVLCVIGGGISYALWTGLSKAYGDQGLSIFLIVISLIPAVIFIAFAFIKIYGLSLMRICLLSLEKIIKPTIRVWTPRTGVKISYDMYTKAKKKTEDDGLEKKKKPTAEELSSLLDVPTSPSSPVQS